MNVLSHSDDAKPPHFPPSEAADDLPPSLQVLPPFDPALATDDGPTVSPTLPPQSRLLPVAAENHVRLLIELTAIAIIIAALRTASGLVIPIAVAFFLAVLSYPVLRFLHRRMPLGLALPLTFAGIVGALAGFVFLTLHLGRELQKDLPTYLTGLENWVKSSASYLESHGIEGASAAVAEFNLRSGIELASQQDVLPRLLKIAGSTVEAATNGIGSTVITLVVMFFLLLEAPSFRTRIGHLHSAGGPDLRPLLFTATNIQRYLGVKTLMSVITGVLAVILCVLADLQYPVLWGLLAFLLNYIPAIGSTTAGAPAVLEALVTHGGSTAIVVGIGYALINFTCDSLIQPVLLGRSFGLSIFAIILSTLFWGWLWGPFGLFLALPITLLIKDLLASSNRRWIAKAMEGNSLG
jgi:AI-2 transport protein TqsA